MRPYSFMTTIDRCKHRKVAVQNEAFNNNKTHVVADSIEELCEKCFSLCKSLSRVTFGESSSLKLIGRLAFQGSGVREIHIPDGVEKLYEECFRGCWRLSRVTFGESSSLKLIGSKTSETKMESWITLPFTNTQNTTYRF